MGDGQAVDTENSALRPDARDIARMVYSVRFAATRTTAAQVPVPVGRSVSGIVVRQSAGFGSSHEHIVRSGSESPRLRGTLKCRVPDHLEFRGWWATSDKLGVALTSSRGSR